MSGPLLTDPAHERLTRLRQAHRPPGPMLPWELKAVYRNRWVRFHSLPESKRYAPGLTRIHHPYDGGADVILPTPEERDRLCTRHSAWLSAHPSGY
ncbi:hypothetical protein AVW11_10610 [Streptomyces amritsarensis]|uniref:DUF3885 domain-containing protein n=1 Tax=Streptomyces amritsarensis TaxID=681158 RepID=A0ABX3G548_9ACTN|nr:MULTISPECIES: hypothetical protein [Streptomyces]OLZ69226.1 hypothetical protein AVW11_10610 [Streptomyces amritsarensis]